MLGDVTLFRAVVASLAIAAAAVTAAGAREERPIHTAAVNGVELAYVEQGSGEPVIFVHGTGADLRTWGYQMEPFGERFRAIAYSRRYHHPNAVDEKGTYTGLVHASDLEAFIEKVAGGPAHLVGSSYGGAVALLVARDRPDLVRSLVLTEPAVFALLPADSPEAGQVRSLHAAGSLLLRGDTDAAIQTFVDTIIGPGASKLMPASTQAMLHDNSPELRLEAAAPETDPAFSCADARRIHTPTLLLTGSASPAFFVAVSRTLAGCLPSVETVTVPGVAHAVHAQEPQRFNELAIGFISRHAAHTSVTGSRFQGHRVTGSQGRKVTGLQGRKVTGFQGP
jgi:pimeloyl-ACP methyl ester carboxylesterase